MNEQRMQAPCRVALAAFLHDIGKFADRARIPQAEDKDQEISKHQSQIQLYCPHWNERASRVHAAHTAIAIDLREK